MVSTLLWYRVGVAVNTAFDGIVVHVHLLLVCQARERPVQAVMEEAQ